MSHGSIVFNAIYSEPGFESAAETLELHATVDGEAVYFLFSCEN